MQLNHLNLCVDNPTEARMLFERSFGFQTVEQRGNAVVLMTDGQGFTLILSDPKAFGSISRRRCLRDVRMRPAVATERRMPYRARRTASFCLPRRGYASRTRRTVSIWDIAHCRCRTRLGRDE